MSPTQSTLTYTECERRLLEQVFEAWEAYSHAANAQDSLQRGDALTTALQRLTDLISAAKISGDDRRVFVVNVEGGKAMRGAGGG